MTWDLRHQDVYTDDSLSVPIRGSHAPIGMPAGHDLFS